MHVYGLTETYGPYSVCQWQQDWKNLKVQERAELLSRQGVGMVQAERLRVVDYAMIDVPADGETMGEMVMRGNNVMKGYFEDDEATGTGQPSDVHLAASARSCPSPAAAWISSRRGRR